MHQRDGALIFKSDGTHRSHLGRHNAAFMQPRERSLAHVLGMRLNAIIEHDEDFAGRSKLEIALGNEMQLVAADDTRKEPLIPTRVDDPKLDRLRRINVEIDVARPLSVTRKRDNLILFTFAADCCPIAQIKKFLHGFILYSRFA